MADKKVETTVDYINRSGYPFQRLIAKEIGDAGWQVDFEYDTRFFPSGYSEERTKVDVLASLGIVYRPMPGVSAIVECKRRDPKYVKWLFFSRKEDTLDNVPTIHGVQVTFCAPDHIGPDGIIYSPRVEFPPMSFPETGYETKCYDYYLEQRTNDKKSASSVEIEGALRQVAVGLRGVIRDLYIDKDRGTGFKAEEVPEFTALLPVVVTTAPIVSCSFEDDKVDLEKGIFLDDKVVDLKSRSWLRCRYALPYELRFHDLRTSSTDDSTLSHLDVWIVGSTNAREFFECVKRDTRHWGNEIAEIKKAVSLK